MKTSFLFIAFFALFLPQMINAQTAKLDNNFSVEIGIDKLNYVRPNKGVGKAGTLNFKTVNLNNNGVVLNLSNLNNIFDAQIFIRPTFLGFTTQFGNFGLTLDETSMLNQVLASNVENTYLILDDNQLNVSGASVDLTNPDSLIHLKNFRLYCQANQNLEVVGSPSSDIFKNCFSFLILNGTITTTNETAEVEYLGTTKSPTGTDKNYLKGSLRSLDLRKKEILVDFKKAQLISNDVYYINVDNLKLNCAKDEDLTSLDLDKIKKSCTNELKIQPALVSIQDKKNKTAFNIDMSNLQIQNQMIYFAMRTSSISDASSQTSLNNTVLNCKKNIDTDVLNLPEVINDCLSFGKFSITEVKSTKNLDANSKDSSIKNILINSTNNKLVLAADVRFLGANHRITIYATGNMNNTTRELSLAVTDVKLPFGINSVKLLMYFLKKMIVSKDVTISGNIIKIAL